MHRYLRPAALAAALAALALVLGACGASSSSHKAAAEAHASTVLANPAASADLNQAETEFLANLKAHFNAAHPIGSMHAAVRATWPAGDTAAITTYALDNFTPAVLTTHGPGSARDVYLQKVYEYAASKGAHPAPSAGASS